MAAEFVAGTHRARGLGRAEQPAGWASAGLRLGKDGFARPDVLLAPAESLLGRAFAVWRDRLAVAGRINDAFAPAVIADDRAWDVRARAARGLPVDRETLRIAKDDQERLRAARERLGRQHEARCADAALAEGAYLALLREAQTLLFAIAYGGSAPAGMLPAQVVARLGEILGAGAVTVANSEAAHYRAAGRRP